MLCTRGTRPIDIQTVEAEVASPAAARRMAVAARIRALQIVLPKFQGAVGTYRKCIRDGDLLYTSTHFGMNEQGKTVPGKVGHGPAATTVSPEEAHVLARNAGLRLLSTMEHFLDGDLDRISQVVKLTGIVNGLPDFTGHGRVIDGCCDVLVEVLGEEIGMGVRTCSGSGSLSAAVTVDLVARVRD
eukprot:SAG25_NODE_1894_length_2187_cov_2.210249_1_plen_186_part_00